RNERKTSGRNRQNPGPETKSATGNHLQAPDLYTEKKTVTLRSKYQRSFINHGFIAVLAKRLAALRPDAINGLHAGLLSGMFKALFSRRADNYVIGSLADLRFDQKGRSVFVAVAIKFQLVRAVRKTLHDQPRRRRRHYRGRRQIVGIKA